MSTEKNQTKLQAAKRIIFLDIGQLQGQVYCWDKKFTYTGMPIMITNNAVIAWEKTPGGPVFSKGLIRPPPATSGKFMTGYEMLNSPGTVDAGARPKKDFIAAVLKYFYDKAAKQWTKTYDKNEVVIVIPVPHFYKVDDKKAMTDAASLAGLCEHGTVLLEDSLYLLAQSAQLAGCKGMGFIRWINLNAPKFEIIDTSSEGKVVGNPYQHLKGLPDMIKEIEGRIQADRNDTNLNEFDRAWKLKEKVQNMFMLGEDCIEELQSTTIAVMEYGMGNKTKGTLRVYGSFEHNYGARNYTVENLSLAEIFFRHLKLKFNWI